MKILILMFINIFSKYNIIENHLVTLIKENNNILIKKNFLINFQMNNSIKDQDIQIEINLNNFNYYPNFICKCINFNGTIKKIQIIDYKKQICTYYLKNIKINSLIKIKYYYKNQLIENFDFQSNLRKNIKIGLFGDHNISEQGKKTINYLNKNKYDLIFHLGDMAYNIFHHNFKKGDIYFKKMKKIMSKNLFLFTPGNHEYFNHTISLNHKFQMPYNIENWKNLKGFENNKYKNIDKYNFGNNLYSFTIKSTFFISVNWELLKNEINMEFLYNWFKNEVEEINNNKKIKFKVFLSHRPFFCSKMDEFFECYRNIFYFKPIFDLLYKYNFDLVITAHVHYFEVTKKINKNFLVDKNNGINYYIVGSGGTSVKFGKIKEFKMNYVEKNEIFKVGILKLIINSKRIDVEYEIIHNDLIFTNNYKNTIDKRIMKKGKYLGWIFIILIICYIIYLKYKFKYKNHFKNW